MIYGCADNRQLFEGTVGKEVKAMEYAIYEGNMERLEKKLTRIFNKCKAYGCDFHYQQTGEVFKELKDENGKTYKPGLYWLKQKELLSSMIGSS